MKISSAGTFKASLILTGISGIIAQIVILRELLINFNGNELTIGIVLSNWLALESIGAFFIGKRIEKIRAKTSAFISGIIIFSLSFPVSVYAARILHIIFQTSPAEAAGITRILLGSLLVLFPVSLTHGMLFTFGCKIHSLLLKDIAHTDKAGASSIGRVYIYDTTGSIIGGILLALYLIPNFDSFHISFGLGAVNFFLCGMLAWVFLKERALLSLKLISAGSFILMGLFAWALVYPIADTIHFLSLKLRWPGQEICYYKNSVYGNITVTKNKDQYTFLSDGIGIITVPEPETQEIEEFAHIPMLFHPGPKNILVIGAGAGGIITELLKHNTDKINYVELDPLLIRAVKEFPVSITEKELSDLRVIVEYTDGRMFTKQTPYKYDLILIGFDNPYSLGINRFFTEEFFSCAKNKLNDNGIIAFQLPGSLTYISDEMKNLNACVLNALKRAFEYTRVIPGDSVNIYLGSGWQQLIKSDEHTLIQRLDERKIRAKLINPFYIKYKLRKQCSDWFAGNLEGGTKKNNTDFRPLGTFYSLAYWNSMLSPKTQKMFWAFEKITIKNIAITAILLGFIISGCVLISKEPLKISLSVNVASAGFSGMLIGLIIIFAFQVIYGYVFYWISLLIPVFMSGMLCGSYIMIKRFERINNPFYVFAKIETMITALALTLPLVFHYLTQLQAHLFLCKFVFASATFLSGLLIGIQFPLANKIRLENCKSTVGHTAGQLYASDLLGGWAGGIIGGVVLLPVLGIAGACFAIAIIQTSAVFIFILSINKAPHSA